MSGQSHSSSTFNFLRRFFQKTKHGVKSCFSRPTTTTAANKPPSTTKVIKPDGTLTEYNVPIRVSHVLLTTQCLSSVLCDSDELCYGGRVRALDSDHLLRPGNIYFVLPKKSLNYPLTVAEMAALATRANTAFAKAAAASTESKKKTRGVWKRVRIVPAVVAADVSGNCYERINQDCVFCSGGEVVVKPEEVFDEGDEKLSDEEFERFMEEMAKRNKKQISQSFYRMKRFVPNLATIPEDYEV